MYFSPSLRAINQVGEIDGGVSAPVLPWGKNTILSEVKQEIE